MPNTRNPSETQTPQSGGRPGQSQDSGRQRQGNQNQAQGENQIDDHDENVEIGDPVPENDRTIRASRNGLSNGQGETGEDEGLSGDAGDDERH
jgi:hypothetical protein